MIRKATAVWTGDLKSGTGTLNAPSGVLKNATYTFATRFEDKPGTNPEELIAAAHAGCFAMALSAGLTKEGLTAEKIETTAEVTLENVDGKQTVTKSHLRLDAHVPGAKNGQVESIANATKAECPISRLLKAEITLETAIHV
ncbi:MAG: OsmC family protein [Candidatus Eisenbacteria bacterium]|uniref:OsmC family protein n=1 Tax=Eiseniibacteriota bacterium TaxID=2212470 RepID=A0A538U829_UNCEI|nr:MAG: OsmC family protein [Candidatus Eisenbacteria bacterium]